MARWYSAHASRYYHLLTAVAQLGHKVIVLQPPSRGSDEANDIDVVLPPHPDVRVITVNLSRFFWNAKFPLEKLTKKLVYSLVSLRLVKRLQREEKIDLVYLYNLPQFAYLMGRRPKVVFDLADDLLGMLETELKITPKHPVHRLASWCLDWMMSRSDTVIVISGPLFDLINHPHRFIIPNGAPVPAQAPVKDPAFKAPFTPPLRSLPGPLSLRGAGPAGMTVGYVGAFEYSMALDQAVVAAEQLPEVNFVLVGAGRDLAHIRAEVDRLALKNVTLTGALPHDEAMRRIDGMDICLNLFHKTRVSHAVSPLKLFEYLSHGKPVISTRLHEVERINEGFLFFADDPGEVVERIRYIAGHRDEAERMAFRGREIVARSFSWPVIAAKFLEAVTS